jgi:hypothetical protein
MVLIITLSGLAFLRMSELETRLTSEEERSTQALLAADAGVRRVHWALRRLSLLQPPGRPYNPFHPQWYNDPGSPLPDRDLLGLVNPQPGETFHPSSMGSYYWITDLSGSGTQVRVRVLGGVDADRDGPGGIGDRDGDGYPDLADADPQDTNRFLEVFLGLAGTPGQDVAVAARDIVDGAGNPVTLHWAAGTTVFEKTHHLAGFWYEGAGGGGAYNTVFSKPVARSESANGDFPGGTPVRLPPGMFKANGTPDYGFFAEFVKQPPYEGNQLFSQTADPTSGANPGQIVWVNGDATIQSVDLGTVGAPGDWQLQDVVLVSTGKITVRNSVSCNWPGRLILVAREVELEGRLGQWVNGLILSSGDIRLRNSPPQPVSVGPGVPVAGSYFFGSMVAGGKVYVHDPGWAVLFDRWVINGVMGHSPPTRILDRFEVAPLSHCWIKSGETTEKFPGTYLQDERNHNAADSGDLGDDSSPSVLRVTTKPTLADGGVGERVRLVVDGSEGAGCTPMGKDWQGFNEIRFHMAVDNHPSTFPPVEPGVPRATREKRATYKLILRDHLGRELETDLDYPQSGWGKENYTIGADVEDPHGDEDDYLSGHLPRWRRMRLPFSTLQPVSGGPVGAFDLAQVRELRFQLKDLSLWWWCQGGAHPLARELRAQTGSVEFYTETGGPFSTRVDTDGFLEYEDPAGSGSWHPAPWGPGEDCPEWGPRVTLGELAATLRVDRLILPGAAMLDHGLPPRFPLEISRWRELTADEAAR